MKNMGEARFLLGIEIKKLANGDVLLVQERYARDVLARFSMTGCKPMSTPLEMGSRLEVSRHPTAEQGKAKMVNIPYRGLPLAVSCNFQPARGRTFQMM